MAFLLSPLGRLLSACAICSLIVGSGAVWATGIYYKSDIVQLKLDAAKTHDANTTAALKQFQDATAKISLAATNYAAIQTSLTSNFDGILKDFRNVKFKAPLPVDCKPTVDRLHTLSAAVTAANSYASVGQ